MNAESTYRINAYRLGFREATRAEPVWLRPFALLVILIAKLLRKRTPFFVYDPKVESVGRHEITGEVPAEMSSVLAAPMAELTKAGFSSPIPFEFDDPFDPQRVYRMTYEHTSGRFFACLNAHKVLLTGRTRIYCHLISRLEDGSFVLTSSAKRELNWPASIRARFLPGAGVEQLIAAHEAALAQTAVVPVFGRESLLEAQECFHRQMRDFHLARGVYQTCTEQELAAAEATEAARASAITQGMPDAEVIAQVRRLENKSGSMLQAVLLLAISAGLFIGVGHLSWGSFVWLILPILLFHELGHYLAMRAFGYRNVRMLFLPMLGAAVTGQKRNVAGWKKIIVYLMGPLPGILVGVVLLALAIVTRRFMFIEAAMLALVLNTLNLLPILPLDGGWVMHNLLFCRHHLLDVIFRGATALACAGIGFYIGDNVLIILGAVMAAGLPLAYRIAHVAHDMSKLLPPSDDAAEVPATVAQDIITRLRAALPKAAGTRALATHCLAVYEKINARPPGWPASLGLLGVYGATLALSVGCLLTIMGGPRSAWATLLRPHGPAPQFSVEPQDLQKRQGSWSIYRSTTRPVRATLVANLAKPAQARASFELLAAMTPEDGAALQIGRTLLLAVGVENGEARRRLLYEFEKMDSKAFVTEGALLRLECGAASATQAAALAEELNGIAGWNATWLIPPWASDDARTPAQRQAHALARRTLSRLTRELHQNVDVKSSQALYQRVAEARRRGEKDEAKRLLDGAQKQEVTRQQQVLARIRAEGPTSVDVELINLYEKLQPLNMDDAAAPDAHQKHVAALNDRLGQWPLIDGKPSLAQQRVSVRSCNANAMDRKIDILVDLIDPVDGAAALLKWLWEKGCTSVRYELIQGNSIE